MQYEISNSLCMGTLFAMKQQMLSSIVSKKSLGNTEVGIQYLESLIKKLENTGERYPDELTIARRVLRKYRSQRLKKLFN